MDLLEKRAKLIAEHEAMEKYDPYWKAEAEAGRSIAARPIAFQCDDEVVIVGEDVATVLSALGRFVELTESDAWKRRAESEHVNKYAESKAKAILARPASAELRLHTQHWNAVALALGEVGQLVVLSGGME